jgi:hypothetical protein
MAGSLVITTRRGAMRPLAVQGIFATDCWHQLRSLLEQRLGSAHANLLAEPVHDPGRESVDWHTGVEGTPVPLSALPPEQADAVRARIGRMAAEIRAAAEEISKDPDSRRALGGQLLLLCLQHPREDDLWLAGDQPLVCCWGFAPGTVGAQPEDLTRPGPARNMPQSPAAVPAAAPAPAVPPTVPLAPVARGAGCLAWLPPFLLLSALIWLLLCRVGLMPIPGGCLPVLFGDDADRLRSEREKGAQSLRDIEDLRAELARRAQQCAPPPAETADPPRVEPFLGESDSPPPPPPKPKEAPKPKPEARPAPQKGTPLTIPGDAGQKNDLSFLDGCWRCETGLVNSRTRRPVIVEYCFDKSGNGRRSVDERGGGVCSGPARAAFDGGGKLRIDAGNAPCPGGSGYVPQTVECTGAVDATHCKGKERAGGSGEGKGGLLGKIFGGGNDIQWDAKFYRK